MEKDEMKCLSCNKVIKARNLKRHSKVKLHLKNVEKKVNIMKEYSYEQVCSHTDKYFVGGVFGGYWCPKCNRNVDSEIKQD
jgi:hypothetical protein